MTIANFLENRKVPALAFVLARPGTFGPPSRCLTFLLSFRNLRSRLVMMVLDAGPSAGALKKLTVYATGRWEQSTGNELRIPSSARVPRSLLLPYAR